MTENDSTEPTQPLRDTTPADPALQGQAQAHYAPAASTSAKKLPLGKVTWAAIGAGIAIVVLAVTVGGVAFGLAVSHRVGDRAEAWGGNGMFGMRGPDQDGQAPGQGGSGSSGPFGGPMMGEAVPGVPSLGGGMMGGLGGALHGDAVVSNGSNGYQTVSMQRGDVTSVSASSITVKSPDGFSATYVVNQQTHVVSPSVGVGGGSTSDLLTGDAVSVMAVGSGSSATAQFIVAGGGGAFGVPS